MAELTKRPQVLGSKSPLFGKRTMQLCLGGFDYLDAARMLERFSEENKSFMLL